jgi:TRAP-type C4-dicarboxylate transport system permease small subunit
MLNSCRIALRVIEKIEIAASIMLFVLIIVSIFAQVVSRYGFGLPIVWVEEAATYAFIWIVFLGAAIGMKRLSHIRIEALSLALPDNARVILRLFGYVVMLFVTLYLCYRLPAVMNIEARSGTVSLPVQAPRMYFYSVPLFVSSASIALTLVYYFVADLVSLLTGAPMTYIDGIAIDDVAREGI